MAPEGEYINILIIHANYVFVIRVCCILCEINFIIIVKCSPTASNIQHIIKMALEISDPPQYFVSYLILSLIFCPPVSYNFKYIFIKNIVLRKSVNGRLFLHRMYLNYSG